MTSEPTEQDNAKLNPNPGLNEGPDSQATEREANILKILWNEFVTRRDAFLEKLDSWVSIKREITQEDIADHRMGKKRYGNYLLSLEGKVRYIVFDLDAHDDPSKKPFLKQYILPLVKWFRDRRICCVVEDTGGFGYHIWVLFHADIYATKALKLARLTLKESGIAIEPEIFPKQVKLDKGGFGNGVRLPWGLHERGEWSHFLNDAFEVDDDSAIKEIIGSRIVDWKQVEGLLPEKGKGGGEAKKDKDIAPDRWAGAVPEGKRHQALFALGCEWRSRGLSPDKLLTELRTHNEARFTPPLPDEEVSDICAGC